MTKSLSTMELEDELMPVDGEDAQTFSPTSRRAERGRMGLGKVKSVRLTSLEDLPKFAKNRYEGVLIASARARQLNAKKVAMEERGMEEALELKRLKMTTFALNELVGGKIDVRRTGASAV